MKNTIIIIAIPFVSAIICFLLFCLCVSVPFILIGYLVWLRKKNSRTNKISDNKKDLLVSMLKMRREGHK